MTDFLFLALLAFVAVFAAVEAIAARFGKAPDHPPRQ